jgi:hypothetical protein
MKILIKENQLSNLSQELMNSDKINEFKIKWDNLNEEDKYFAKNILDTFYPNHYGQINEAWWNTIGDVVGIFDPTGIVDFVNGLDYIRQGDYFFGLLSMVAIVPYFGDLVAKPITLLAKTGKMKGVVNKAMGMAAKGDSVGAIKLLQESSKMSQSFRKFLIYSEKWGIKLKEILRKMENALPGGKLTSGLRQTIEHWIDIFINASKSISGSRKIVGGLAKKVGKISPTDADKLAKEYIKLLGKTTRPVTYTQIKNPDFMLKYVWPGLLARGKNTRMLVGMMRKTKFYAGLLDYIGIANFVGPDELINKIGKETLDKEMENYMKTPEAKQYYEEDMDSLQESPRSQPQTQQTTTQTQGSNPLIDFLTKQILGPIV